jgi:hypothetical protein
LLACSLSSPHMVKGFGLSDCIGSV